MHDHPLATRLALALGLAAFALGLVLARPAPVAAECDGPVPSFRRFAASAETIVVGDVVAANPSGTYTDDHGRSSWFTIRVREGIKGDAPGVLRFRDLPFLPCSDHIVRVAAGDRIALALDATTFSEPPTVVNIPAWIHGEKPPWSGAQRVTRRGVWALVGMEPPATDTGAAPSTPARSELPLLLLAALIGAALPMCRNRARRT
jgi:hypothetical protein